jgi:ankyrin repeat protein
MDLFQMVRRTDDLRAVLAAIDSADINVIGRTHQNLLHVAIARNKPDLASELLRRQIDVNCQDKDGMTPLHYTAWDHQTEIAAQILAHGGGPGIRDRHGDTALWYAVFHARGKHYDLVELLMKAGSDPVSMNSHGRSPRDFAAQIKDDHLLQLFTRSVDG